MRIRWATAVRRARAAPPHDLTLCGHRGWASHASGGHPSRWLPELFATADEPATAAAGHTGGTLEQLLCRANPAVLRRQGAFCHSAKDMFPNLPQAALYVESRIPHEGSDKQHLIRFPGERHAAENDAAWCYAGTHTSLPRLLHRFSKRQRGHEAVKAPTVEKDGPSELERLVSELMEDGDGALDDGEAEGEGGEMEGEDDAVTEQSAAEAVTRSRRHQEGQRRRRRQNHLLLSSLSSLSRASPFSFYLTFEALVRQGQPEIALQLFEQWWWYGNDGQNCVLFPVEFDKAGVELPAVRDHAHFQTGDVTTEAASDGERRACLAKVRVLSTLSRNVPYKKYYVTCALLPRVIVVALQTGSAEAVERLVVQRIIKQGILQGICGGSNVGCANASPLMDPGVRGFDPVREEAGDWAALVGVLAACGLLNRHLDALREAQLARHTGKKAEMRGADVATPRTYREVVRQVRAEYVHFMGCGFFQGAEEECSAGTAAAVQDAEVPGWVLLIFTTVLECYESSGTLHAIPARRPLTAAVLWEQIHYRATTTFPHVFHSGSTVGTLLCFAALEGCAMSGTSSASASATFVGKIETVLAWRQWQVHGGAGWRGPTAPSALSGVSGMRERRRALKARFVANRATENLDEGVELEEGSGDARPKGPASHHRPSNTGAPLDPPVASFQLSSVDRTRSWQAGAAAGIAVGGMDLAVGEVQERYELAVRVFQQHAAQRMLRKSYDIRLKEGLGGEAAAEADLTASRPSVYVFVRLLSLLAQLGYHPHLLHEGPPDKANAVNHPDSTEVPFVTCVERDIVPHCHRVLSGYLRKQCAVCLSRSGSHGLAAMERLYQNVFEELEESTAMERVVFALLWSGGMTTAARPQSEADDISEAPSESQPFGSGSLAWQFFHERPYLLSQPRQSLHRINALTFLAVLAQELAPTFRIPLLLPPPGSGADAPATSGDPSEVLQAYPRADRHLYESLVELLDIMIRGAMALPPAVADPVMSHKKADSEAVSDPTGGTDVLSGDSCHVKIRGGDAPQGLFDFGVGIDDVYSSAEDPPVEPLPSTGVAEDPSVARASGVAEETEVSETNPQLLSGVSGATVVEISTHDPGILQRRRDVLLFLLRFLSSCCGTTTARDAPGALHSQPPGERAAILAGILSWEVRERAAFVLTRNCPDVHLIAALLLVPPEVAAPIADGRPADEWSALPMSERVLSGLCHLLWEAGGDFSHTSGNLTALRAALVQQLLEEREPEPAGGDRFQPAALNLLGRLVANLLASPRWRGFARRNFYASEYCRAGSTGNMAGPNSTGVPSQSGFPLGVVLPSLQLSATASPTLTRRDRAAMADGTVGPPRLSMERGRAIRQLRDIFAPLSLASRRQLLHLEEGCASAAFTEADRLAAVLIGNGGEDC